jgi:predicted DNA-binding transcriptional regulator AlpA
MANRLLSVHDLVILTGWSVFTIYKKSSAGEIPGRVKIGKGSLRFRESEVEEWLLGKSRGGEVIDGETEAGA